ncbi:ribonuclease H-like domain-containing protein [Alteribacter lacisalsi]|uniref:ribonuclease H-like domain-containing protein n=1 Tax=Alteribacter lacisalsi TaxID=2045244 RepID=UPI001374E252|nr:ribonuclease H-like domain-containing protein [Alteribacter lacisalsi]
MNLKGKLNRMKGYIKTEETEERGRAVARPEKDHDASPGRHGDRWKELGFKPHWFEGEYSLVRRKSYPLDYRHGSRRFSELPELKKSWDQASGHPLDLSETDPESLLFFDTETTGLSSGAGTTIFLMGYSRIRGNEVEVIQHFLPGPAEEAAFFHGFLTDFNPDHSLVSYNGKAFDWPHVKSRHAFVRNEVPKLPLFGHFDLLHAARRLWKHELPSCRLSIVEEEKLGVRRVNETPGSLAPILYFEYLQHQDPAELEGIFRHHELDVLSLIVLYAELSSRLLVLEPSRPSEHYQMGRWFEQLKKDRHAENHYREALKDQASPESAVRLAGIMKKRKAFTESEELLLASLQIRRGGSALRAAAYTELAKLYEHQFKDLEKALDYAKRAVREVREGARAARTAGKKDPSLEKRAARLQQKLEKGAHRS